MRGTLLALILTFGISVRAEEVASFTSGGFVNGRFWKVLDDTAKISFLYGLSTGSRLVLIAAGNDASAEVRQVPQLFTPAELSYKEWASTLDQFYADPANSNVMVFEASVIQNHKVQGASAEDLASETAAARKRALELEAVATKKSPPVKTKQEIQ